MAKFVNDVPGIEMTLYPGKVVDNTYRVPAKVKITNMRKFMWYVVRTEFQVRFWQWPWVLYLIAKTHILWKLGKEPLSEGD